MKKSLLWILVAGFFLAAGLSGYLVLHRAGSDGVKKPENVSTPVSGAPDVSIPASGTPAPAVSQEQQSAAVASRRLVAAKNPGQSQPAIQVVAAPGDRFQPLDEALILDQRVSTVSKDRKKRELLVQAGGKYPVHRIQETLVKNEGADTYSIQSRSEMVASHVLVKLQEGRTEDDLQAMLKGYGVSILRPLALPGHYIISLKAPTLDAVPEALSVFAGESNLLAYVEPDYISHIQRNPGDARWSELWGMRKINATGAWDVVTGSTNVIVAVVDTGVSLAHPDLSSNIWKNVAEVNGAPGVDDDGNGYIDDVNGWDFAGDDNNPDDSGAQHGTHCAGTIGAVGNNGVGVAGVCWSVRVMALRGGSDEGLYQSDTAEAVQYAADNGAKVISASYGGGESSYTERYAISYANSNGVLFVAAAGNESLDTDAVPMYPAGYDLPNIVSVAATDQNDALASFSNYGKTSVDLAAPGVSILSTVPGGSYDSYQGTSMACPHVAGTAALLLSAKPVLTHLQVKAALLNTVDKLPALAAKTVSGGRLNVKKLIALQDTDGDGMPDEWELANGLSTNSPIDAAMDPDGDYLNNLGEYENRCITTNADTDTDTLADGWEVTYGFDPNSSTGSLAASSSLGVFGISGGSKNLAVGGNYAYVAAGSAGLFIVDISDPENPVLAGSYATKTANDVAVSNGYAYVASGGNADGTNGLLVLNVSNPALPTRSGFLKTTNGAASGVAVQGNYAYLADGTNNLVTVDVSNKVALRVTSHAIWTDDMHDVFVQGDSVYAALYQTVWRFDLANPAVPAWRVAATGLSRDMIGLHGNGSVIVAVAGTNGVSIRSTALSQLIPGNGFYDTDGTASGVFVSGNNVYVADGANGLVILDISTPSAPTQVVRIPTVGSANGVFVSDDKVYVATSTGLEVLSVLPDADADGLPNSWEMTWFGNLGQNRTNDYDNDGISNWGEYLAGLNPINSDQDGDGLIDGLEASKVPGSTNVFYNTDPRLVDTDGDGLVDGYDGFVSTNTYPAGVDVSSNGVPGADGFVDGELDFGCSALDTDSDGDGMNDGWEVRYGFNPDNPADPGPSGDVDGDGLTNLEESQNGTDPRDADTDNDGMPDGWEVDNGLNPLVDDANGDADSDGLTNLQEYGQGTNPNNPDTDGDTMPDGWEFTYMPPLNPTNSLDGLIDSDLDGLTNKFEYSNGCNPTNSDTDGDGMPDGWEVNYGLSPISSNGVNGASGDPDGDNLLNIQEYSLGGSNLWLGVYTSVTGAPATFFFGPPLGTPGMPGSTDPMDTDSDNDDLTDYYEITMHTSTNVAGGITNIFTYVTNPNNPDTDGDGFSDSWEIINGFNPIFVEDPHATDRDDDGFTDAEESALGTQPNNRLDPVCVDDDAPSDPWPLDPVSSDPLENGSRVHPFDAIQEAISTNTTVNGMTILVANGTYMGAGNYNIDTHGKAIRIISWSNDPSSTIVNSRGYGPVFTLSSGETTNTVIKGLGITVTLNPCSDGDCDTEHGVVLNNASPYIENCRIFDCELDGIHCENNSSPVIKDCQVSNVRNGIWCEGGSSPRIENCTITTIGHHEAGDAGIGIYADSSSGLYVGNTVVSNCNGRGIVLKDSANAIIETSILIENGGGITCDNSSPRIERCEIRNNDAPNYFTIDGYQFVGAAIFQLNREGWIDTTDEDENGGGILMLRGSSPFIVNSLIVNNRTWADDPLYSEVKLAPDFGLGGGFYIGDGCFPSVVNCTVADNHAHTRGGGLSSFQSPLLRNMIFWGNTSSNAIIVGAPPAQFRNTSTNSLYRNLHCRSGSINIWYSDIEYGYPTATLSSTNNPLFAGDGDYRLASTNSPCYNSGTFELAPTNDLDGNPRPTNLPLRVDMGCYEGVGGGGGNDTDGDGLPDTWEFANGLSPTNAVGADGASGDPDGDMLTNAQEYNMGTNPQVADTDGDTMPDGWEFTYMPPLSPINILDGLLDSDMDGLTNKFEYSNGCDPTNPDTDGDGLPDGWEVNYTLSPTNAVGVDGASGDPDSDTLTNLQEYELGTNPRVADTDGDGLADNVEVSLGTQPTNGHDPVYVDDDAAGDVAVGGEWYSDVSDPDEDGSVAHPFDSIQEAIDTNTTVSGMMVLVKDGLYWGTGNYAIDTKGKSLKIRSENGPAVTEINSYDQGPAIQLSSGDTNTLIQGFSITPYGGWDAALMLDNASIRIDQCRIYDSLSSGIQCLNGASPVISSCTVYSVNNGIYSTSGSGITIKDSAVSNCTGRGIWLANNTALQILDTTVRGCAGGIRLDASHGLIERCEIGSNVASDYPSIDDPDENGAGLLLLGGSSPRLVNLLITSNQTTATAAGFGQGGGLYVGAGCSPTNINCTIADNSARSGGGIANYGNPNLRNMIIWGNAVAVSNASIFKGTNTLTITYSCVQGGYSPVPPTAAVITNNPLFAGNGNYRLSTTNSPCYNSGTSAQAPTNDLDGNLRPLAGKFDMGCYEGVGSGGGAFTDTDGDGMPDIWENANGLDPLVNDAALDPDVDGLTNLQEYNLGTDPQVADTDGDTMPDGWEVTNGLNPSVNDAALDPDGDGLTNLQEYTLGTNPQVADTDIDGMPDAWENANGLNPLVNDAALDPDIDGLTNLQEYTLGANPQVADTDGDTMPDGWEFTYMPPLNPTNSLDGLLDSDLDGLTNKFEYSNGCNPTNSDTDADGLPDGWEVGYTLSPTNTVGDDGASGDPDLDTLTNLQEYNLGTNPRLADTDGDGLADNAEGSLGTSPTNSFDPVYVDDDAPGDVLAGNPNISDSLENGSAAHPFDSIQEAISTNTTVSGMTIFVTNGLYEGTGNYDINPHGKNLRILSWNGSSNTTIKTHAYGSAFIINTGESTNTIIRGFTIETQGDLADEEGVVVSGARPVLQDLVIHNCGKEAVSCINGASPQIVNCRFYDVPNGLYASGSAGVLLQQSVISNTTGRGIVIVNDDLAEVTWSTIENCAGGITLNGSDAEISQCIVRNNTNTNGTGAGILLLGNSSPLIQNALIVSNRAGTGGGLYISTGCNPTGVNCTVVNNSAANSGGGVSSGGRPVFRNMIFWGNTATSNANLHVSTNVINIWYSDIQYGHSNAVLCVTNDPLFVGGGDYHLASTNSPCYNSGDFYLAPTNDLDGNLRPTALPQKVDMGCYEGVSSPIVSDTDGDGMPDIWENANGLDPLVNDAALDPDSDTLTNLQEYDLGADPQVADTDGDTMPDGWEFTYMPPLSPTNSLDGLLDSDMDGLTNKFEYSYGCNPTNSDTDADGLPDGWEVGYTLSPTNTVGDDGASGDPDSDTLTNLQEYQLGTNPRLADTDNDGLADNVEVTLGTLPANGHDPVYVDDNAPTDPMPGEPGVSNTNENGSITYPFDSIQEAIDSSNTVNGMTILVTNGLYEGTGNFDITPRGKALRILSVNGSANTFIITHAYGPAFVINGGETTNTVIQGFTIETYGDLAPVEGIVVNGASPVLQDMVIHNCELEAVSCINGAAPRIINCRFYDVPNGLYANGSAGVLLQQSVISNTTGRGIVIVNDDLAEITWSTVENCAGGITLSGSGAEIRQCIVRNNTYTNGTGTGAGILIANNSSPRIQNTLIVGNVAADSGGGLYIQNGCNPTGVNCTVANNSATNFGGGVSSGGRPVFRNMIFWDNTATSNANLHVSANVINVWFSDIEYGYSNAVLSITANPQFVGGGDYSLQAGSPCIEAGTYYLAPLVDLDGNLRPTFADYPVRVDMGCYQFGAPASTNPIALGAELPLDSGPALGAEASPLADTDGDGVSNGAEMIAGTDAYSPSSYFRVYHEQSQADGSVLIAWQSVAGCLYTVQSTDNLVSGVWDNVAGFTDLSGDGTIKSYSAPRDSAVRYYRVVVRRP